MKYSGGPVCNATGLQSTFTVNILCNSSIPYDYDVQISGTECDPYVNLISEYGCSVLDVSMLWEYIADYKDYWGAALLVIGIMMCFFGRKLIPVSVCVAGFLTCTAVACFIFYAVYL